MRILAGSISKRMIYKNIKSPRLFSFMFEKKINKISTAEQTRSDLVFEEENKTHKKFWENSINLF